MVWRDDASHLTDPAFTQGCTVKQRANGLEPGLYFRPLAREQAEFPAAWAGTSGALPPGRLYCGVSGWNACGRGGL